MPYFVFRVKPFAQIEKLAEFEAFREASGHAKTLRAQGGEGGGRIKLMFAESAQLAEDLLCQIRDPQPGADD